jgi:hypothetical protein
VGGRERILVSEGGTGESAKVELQLANSEVD